MLRPPVGTVDDALAELPEPGRSCLQHIVAVARSVATGSDPPWFTKP